MNKGSEGFKVGEKLGRLILEVDSDLVPSKVTLLALAIIREYHPEIDLNDSNVRGDVIYGLTCGYLAGEA